MTPRRPAILRTVAAEVRRRRAARGYSRRELAEKSGLSERFLAQVEGGTGNISVARLAELARVLGVSPGELLAPPVAVKKKLVALLGMRGAGKSSVGRRLAELARLPFVELDRLVEDSAGLRLGALFELHGEGYYRRAEREALQRLVASGKPAVVATGGSLVTDPETFRLLRESAVTLWLRATPEAHWSRVLRQGDRRPMGKNPRAFDELRALLAARAPLYAQADHALDTTALALEESAHAARSLVSSSLPVARE